MVQASVKKRPSVFIRIASGLLFLAASLCFLFEAGAYLPFLPYVGTIGNVVVTYFDCWILVVSIAAGIPLALLWRRYRTRFYLISSIISGLSVVMAVIVIVAIASAMHPFGIRINPLAEFNVKFIMGEQPDSETTFEEYAGQPLKVMIWRPHSPTSGKLPVMLYVHGGGFTGGFADFRAKDMRWFADRGWLVMATEYSLSTKEKHYWDVTLDQVGCGMVWAQKHAAEFGGSSDALFLIGDSAGGNLALRAAFGANRDLLTSHCGRPPHVRAVSVMYPVIDLAANYGNGNPNPLLGPTGRMFSDSYLGGTPAQFPGRYSAVNPTSLIGPGIPPTQIVQPNHDHLVLPGPNIEFFEKVTKQGVDARMVKVPFGEHGDDLTDNGINDQILRQATLQFFSRYR
jgi:acetyl esterase/lipase